MATTHAVVELRLDEQATALLRHAWTEIAEQGIDSSLQQSGARPHVSLVVGAGLDVEYFPARLRETVILPHRTGVS